MVRLQNSMLQYQNPELNEDVGISTLMALINLLPKVPVCSTTFNTHPIQYPVKTYPLQY